MAVPIEDDINMILVKKGNPVIKTRLVGVMVRREGIPMEDDEVRLSFQRESGTPYVFSGPRRAPGIPQCY